MCVWFNQRRRCGGRSHPLPTSLWIEMLHLQSLVSLDIHSQRRWMLWTIWEMFSFGFFTRYFTSGETIFACGRQLRKNEKWNEARFWNEWWINGNVQWEREKKTFSARLCFFLFLLNTYLISMHQAPCSTVQHLPKKNASYFSFLTEWRFSR